MDNVERLSLDAMSGKDLDALLTELDTDAENGLDPEQALRRLSAEGANELRASPPVPVWRRVLAQFQDPLIYLLLLAVVISLVAWWIEGAVGVPVDAVVITLVVIANAVLGFVQESRAERAVAALQAMSHPHARVVRGGRTTEITARDVVTGDILLLSEGDSVAADGRLLASSALRVAEAALTGESAAVGKQPGALAGDVPLGDRTNMVFSGTAVTQGTGRAVVTATGMDTQMGEVARLLDETTRDVTPLEREIAFVGKMLGVAVIAIAVVVMVTVWFVSGVDALDDAVGVLLLGVSLAVAAVPEGLPAILSVVLSIGVQKMARRDAIVKDLASVETLGSASVICSDKTGTLTNNEMTVQEIRTLSGTASVSGVGYAPDGVVETGSDEQRLEDELVLMGGALSSNAELREDDGEWRVLGDPTEGAFLVAERKLGMHEHCDQRFSRITEVPFTSERKRMSTLQRDHERDQVVLVTKGAPDVVLDRCTSVRRGHDAVELTRALRDQLLTDVEEMGGRALRTMGVAFREVADSEAPGASDDLVDAELAEPLEEGLTYLGTVGMIDPAREEAADAVARAQRAGIRVIMITGDHPGTALRIAQDLGITDADGRAVTGTELDRSDDEGFATLVREANVFARVAPEHKLRIVDALQADGHVVAMTGDGVNDAPALKSADIGVAMGITGTEVTKEAGSMILRDDNFATIVAAVEQGRVIFDDIKKFLRYLLSSNMGEVLTVFFGVVLAGVIGLTAASEAAIVVPLLATQILWINLVTDSAPALALGVDPPTDDVMARRPRALGERVIDLPMWGIIVFVGAVMAASTLLTLDIFLTGGLIAGDDDLVTARTAAFTTLVFAQLFNVFSARSAVTTAFHGLGSNRWLLAAVAFGAIAQVAVVEVPLLQTAFGTTSLDAQHWLVTVGMASTVLWAEEIRKLAARARRRSTS